MRDIDAQRAHAREFFAAAQFFSRMIAFSARVCAEQNNFAQLASFPRRDRAESIKNERIGAE